MDWMRRQVGGGDDGDEVERVGHGHDGYEYSHSATRHERGWSGHYNTQWRQCQTRLRCVDEW